MLAASAGTSLLWQYPVACLSLFCVQITEEQRLRADLEHQVEALRQRIAEQRVAMGGINNSAEQALKVHQGW